MNGFSTIASGALYLGLGLGLGLLLGIGSIAGAAPDSPADLAAVKRSALAVLRAQARPPAAGELAIDVGAREPSLLLDEAELIVDRLPAVRYRYGADDAQALHQGALHPLARLALAPGRHRLRLQLAALHADAPPDRPRAIAAFEREVEIDAQTTTLQFELITHGVLGQPDITLHPLAPMAGEAASPDHYVAGSGDDPRLREAVYLIAAARPLAALQMLYALEAGAGPYAASAELRAKIDEATQAFGLDAPAGGAEAPALAAFNQAGALLREGRVAEASAALDALANMQSDDDTQALLRDRANLLLGYALLRQRAGAAAAPLFGRVRSTGPCTNAALLGLGWAMLAPASPATTAITTATGALPRIPTLLQATQRGPRAAYAPREATADEERAVRRALVPWTELIGRDPLDPAVQEGAVAIPYALNHIGAHEQAIDYYRRALYLLEAVDHQLDLAIREVAAGGLRARLAVPVAEDRGWPWWIAALPPQHWWLANDPAEALAAPAGFYLPRLIDEPGFRGAMADWHDLLQLDAALAALGDAPDAEPARTGVDAALAAQARALDQRALADLRQIQRSTRAYLGEARFALGRVNEEPVREAHR